MNIPYYPVAAEKAIEEISRIQRELNAIKATAEEFRKGLELIASDGSHNSGEWCAAIARGYLQAVWVCPRCQRVLGPQVVGCDACNAKIADRK